MVGTSPRDRRASTLPDRALGSDPLETGLMNRWRTSRLIAVPTLLAAGGFLSLGSAQEAAAPVSSGGPDGRGAVARFVGQFCVECHNREDRTAGLALDALVAEEVGRNS